MGMSKLILTLELILILKNTVMFDFQKLEVYKKAKLFHFNCKELLFHQRHEKYVVDQLGRASFSIVPNIAEGSGKPSPGDRRNYFTIARGSVFESVTVLDLLFDEGKITDADYTLNLKLADEISRMLFALIRIHAA
jgi:four helix bundle protein